MPVISNFRRFRTAAVVTTVNAAANSLLALFKILVGYLGYSQALIADGLHSFSDLITDGLVLFAARMGSQSPDKEHPYGHRRIETISAVIISLVLIAVGLGIAYDSIHHLTHRLHLQKPGWSVVVVAVVSVIANEGLFRYTLHQGNKIQSDLLRTNAWHNRGDALTSIIVLISVIGALFGVLWLDAIGALIIAALILKMGIRITWKSIKELIDTGVDESTLKKISGIISSVSGVVAIHQLRTRSHGDHVFVDVHIQVQPNISVSEGHYISEQVHLMLMNQLDCVADVTVHIDPEDDQQSMLSINLPNRNAINESLQHCWKNLPGNDRIRRKVLHYLNGKLQVEIYLPLEVVQDINRETLEAMYNESIQHKEIVKVTIYLT